MTFMQWIFLLVFGVPYTAMTIGMFVAPRKVTGLFQRIPLALGVPEDEVCKSRFNWWVHWLTGAILVGLFIFFGWLGV